MSGSATKELGGGPWHGYESTRSPHRWDLTRDDVLDLVACAPDEANMLAALEVDSRSDPKFNRAVTLAKQAGLLKYRGGKWVRP